MARTELVMMHKEKPAYPGGEGAGLRPEIEMWALFGRTWCRCFAKIHSNQARQEKAATASGFYGIYAIIEM